jgi:hypothetical protein
VLGGLNTAEIGAPQSTICTTFPSIEFGKKWYVLALSLIVIIIPSCWLKTGKWDRTAIIRRQPFDRTGG